MSFNADSDNLCLYFNPKIDRENSFNLMSDDESSDSSDSSRSSELLEIELSD